MKIYQTVLDQESNLVGREDILPEQRARRSFLLGLRYHLKKWGFANVRVDDDFMKLSVGSEEVVSAQVVNYRLICTWNPTWES